MNKQLEERISIIESFKSTYYWQDRSAEKQYMVPFLRGISSLLVGVLLLLMMIYASAMTVLKIEPASLRWAECGLLVFASMSANFWNPSLFIEFMLKKHLKKIGTVNIAFKKESNTDLQHLILKLNSKIMRLYTVVIPSILIMIAAILQSIKLNPFWDLCAYVILIYSVFMLVKIFSDITTMRKNLIQFEKVNI